MKPIKILDTMLLKGWVKKLIKKGKESKNAQYLEILSICIDGFSQLISD